MTHILRVLFCALLVLNSAQAYAKDVVVLLDETSSVIARHADSEFLVTEIAQALTALLTEDTELNRRVWSTADLDKLSDLQRKPNKISLNSFGGVSPTDSDTSNEGPPLPIKCDSDFITRSSKLSADKLTSKDLTNQIIRFYVPHIFGREARHLKEPAYESPELAQWHVWQEIKQQNPTWEEYYQILITNDNPNRPKRGKCQQDTTIEKRIQEWKAENQIEELAIFKYQGSYAKLSISIKVSKISSLADKISLMDLKIDNVKQRVTQNESDIAKLQEQITPTQTSTPSSELVDNDSENATKTDEEGTASTSTPVYAYALNNLWVLIAAILVIFMQAGFALLESGFNASKNTVNIMFKNVMDFSVGVLLFFIVGYMFMFSQTYLFLGLDINYLGLNNLEEEQGGLSTYIHFLFQAGFAATAATICAGSVAGRLKFVVYLIYSAMITGFIYPISGHWVWGGGWLAGNYELFGIPLEFHDFAGSVVVHAVGGFAGLAGAMVLGPRLGRFGYSGKNTEPTTIKNLDKWEDLLPHNLALAGLGMFILWIGWYGFNAGSELAIVGHGSTNTVALIAINTTLSAAAGAVSTMIFTSFIYNKSALSLTLNGAIGGLVGITACCDALMPWQAIIVGTMAGGLVVLGISLLEKAKIDDPVGAWPVHGLCGIWGCIAYALFYTGDASISSVWLSQIVGSIVIVAWSFVTMFILFWIIDKLHGIRISETEEHSGLDDYYHGEKAYRHH